MKIIRLNGPDRTTYTDLLVDVAHLRLKRRRAANLIGEFLAWRRNCYDYISDLNRELKTAREKLKGLEKERNEEILKNKVHLATMRIYRSKLARTERLRSNQINLIKKHQDENNALIASSKKSQRQQKIVENFIDQIINLK